MNIRLSKDQKIKILNSEDLYKIMQQVLLRENKIERNKEHFWIVCLANNNQILLIELISLGTVNKTLVEPMEVFSFALQKRAVKIIMVHNHPSGEKEPSMGDIEITDKMVAIGKFLNVPVIDHLIITEKDYYSFIDSGLLSKIQKETTFDLSFKKIKSLKKEIQVYEKSQIAKAVLAKNVDLKVIKESTGLTKKQIEKLSKK
ncbi:MAG: RadC family protein [Cytophagaceae bacterium]